MNEFLQKYKRYTFSIDGKITNHQTGHCIIPYLGVRGYLLVNLYNSECNKKTIVPVHRIIAILFIPNPHGYKCVNHIDGNKQNNHVSNLEWCSSSYNNAHAYQIGLKKPHTENGKSIKQLTLNGEFVKAWDSINEAGRALNMRRSHISEVVSGKRKSAYGYIWQRD